MKFQLPLPPFRGGPMGCAGRLKGMYSISDLDNVYIKSQTLGDPHKDILKPQRRRPTSEIVTV